MSYTTKPEGLGCDHCGGTAIEFKPPAWPGHFWHLHDGDGGHCNECGFPGHVSVDDGYSDEALARWMTNDWDDGLKCKADDCEDCQPQRQLFEGE